MPMAGLLAERLISLAQGAKLFPGARANKHLNPSTLFRWCMSGATAQDGSKVKLEYVRLGGRILTTHEALSRFAARLTGTDADPPPAPRSPTQRDRAAARADRELAGAGW